MSKFHINKHGVPAPCRAKKGNCPLGGEDNHFDNIEDAQAAASEMLENSYGIIPKVNDDSDVPNNSMYSLEDLEKRFPELNKQQIEEVKFYIDIEEDIYNRTEELKSSSDEYMATDEYFDKVQDLREMANTKYYQYNAINEYLEDEKINDILEPMLPGKPVWERRPGYQFHPDIDEKNFNYGIGPVMSSYSGKDLNEIKSEIKELEEKENISFNDAARKYWGTLKQRNDKPIVSVDLETANPQDMSLNYDNGQLTHIIEFGAIKTYPDGRVEKMSFLNGIPEEFNDRNGTGFVQTHNITYDMISDKEEFTNEANQKKLLEFLDGSVLMAHNARFEDRQLTNSLRGYKGKVNSGNIELLDTMNFCKFMVPESKRNTNEAFVHAAGMEYEGAHRAYSDAEMTLNAFNKLKDNR